MDYMDGRSSHGSNVTVDNGSRESDTLLLLKWGRVLRRVCLRLAARIRGRQNKWVQIGSWVRSEAVRG
ncbi:unnamed protein product [Linum trigynum]|uniref:Uncharacterized protein n=1 Tax=Linum trigynum TaxID=586398 RepID=A0AAV2FA24_9ROSI